MTKQEEYLIERYRQFMSLPAAERQKVAEQLLQLAESKSDRVKTIVKVFCENA